MRQPNLRDLRIETIYVKIVREDHGRALERIGATGVILPERDLARKLAKTLVLPNPIDYLSSSEKYNVVETAPPKDFIGKTLAHLSLGNEHKINILGVRDVVPGEGAMNSGGGFTLEDGDILLALGKPEDIRKLKGEERETAGQGFGSRNERYPSTEKLIEKNSHAKGKIPSRTRISRTEYMIMVLSLSGVFGHGGKRDGSERKRIRIQSQNHPGE